MVTIVNLAERPDLVGAMWAMHNDWPAFMQEDPLGDLFFGQLPELFPEHQLVALDDAGNIVAKVHSLPFVWDGSDADLPARGWDAVLERGFTDQRRGRTPNAASLLEARIVAGQLSRGLSAELVRAAADNTARLGLADLVAPVRPNEKHLEPRTPMAEYALRVRADGLPVDPWLRVHVRLGGRIVNVCPASMTVPGTLAQWRAWTGLPFDVSGQVEVPFALAPVHVSVEQDAAVYVEPNVWVHHRR